MSARIMLLGALLVVGLCIEQRVSIAEEATGAFAVGIPPGEGLPVLRSRGLPLTLKLRPGHRSRDVGVIKVGSNTEISFSKSIVITLKAATVFVTKDASIRCRQFGNVKSISEKTYYGEIPEKTIKVIRGDKIEYLQDRAEGTCFFRFHAEVFEAQECSWSNTANFEFRMEGEPIAEWWVFVKTKSAVAGWLRVDPKVIDVTRN